MLITMLAMDEMPCERIRDVPGRPTLGTEDRQIAAQGVTPFVERRVTNGGRNPESRVSPPFQIFPSLRGGCKKLYRVGNQIIGLIGRLVVYGFFACLLRLADFSQ